VKHERRIKAESITKKLISEFIVTQLQDISIDHGIVTVTKVEITNDSSYTDIFVSCMQKQETLTKRLSEHAHPIHRMLGRELAFIKVPKVRFKYDES